MSYKGATTISIPEETKYLLKAVSNGHTYKETIEALIEIEEMVRRLVEQPRKDAVKVKEKFEKLLREEGLI